MGIVEKLQILFFDQHELTYTIISKPPVYTD